ncbi:MAG: bifunctional adenosylcobinamide kinase/adenosylcobinamide-phosphate guanylyltransferase [Candidatus Omnitrophota bacterium]|jgi:adenosylcobinamide kinase/adenosylcobinamide-phosphate guanylyltransferase
MSRIIFVLGGARSGKSRYASLMAKRSGQKTVFIATATALDDEMRERIRLHKISRPKDWSLIEEPLDLRRCMLTLKPVYGTALIDCLGLWISNLLMTGMKDTSIEKMIKGFVEAARKAKAGTVIIVSNEVGSGIVPADPLSRRFRDLIGLANQAVAEKADDVFFMHAGIPVKLK